MSSSDRPTIVNLTPHDIVVEYAPGKRNVYPASGHVARVLTSEQEQIDVLVDGTPVYERQTPAGLEMLVAEADRDATAVIVSMFAAQFLVDAELWTYTIKSNLRTQRSRLCVYNGDVPSPHPWLTCRTGMCPTRDRAACCATRRALSLASAVYSTIANACRNKDGRYREH